MIDSEILTFLLSSGNIDLTEVRLQMEMAKKEEYLSKHQYSIWQSKNGNWYTYFPDKEKGRVMKYRSTKEGLEKLIVQFYKDIEGNPTIEDVFYEWINERLFYEEIERSTYTRYVFDFERSCKKIRNRKIREITEIEVENFIRSELKEKEYTRKGFSNLRTVLYGIFKYANKHKYSNIDIRNLIDNMCFSKRQFVRSNHNSSEQIFYEDEEEKLFRYMKQNEDIFNLGIMLLFKTGLRIGELVSLKLTDISDDLSTISITRTETIFRDEDRYVHYIVKDTPKTEAGVRDVIVPESCKEILAKMLELSKGKEYIMYDTERIRSYRVRQRLYTNCEKVGIKKRGLHKIRKTYGTKLYDSGVTESLIIEQMGHTDITCLKQHYYYNRQQKQEKFAELNKVQGL